METFALTKASANEALLLCTPNLNKVFLQYATSTHGNPPYHPRYRQSSQMNHQTEMILFVYLVSTYSNSSDILSGVFLIQTLKLDCRLEPAVSTQKV